jgi:DMSO/TMAO reductase YedYZ molybdopterin-dependent catalytic subunit
MYIYRLCGIACLIFIFSLHSMGQGSFIKVSGEVTKPLSISPEEFSKMKRSTATMKDRDGKDHVYTGVALQDLLGLAGVTTGDQLRGEQLTKYVLAKCADGYEVLFSLAELDSTFTNRVVILADQLEGKPLPAGKGPFRLVVPNEKKPARSSFQVTELVIRYAK